MSVQNINKKNKFKL